VRGRKSRGFALGGAAVSLALACNGSANSSACNDYYAAVLDKLAQCGGYPTPPASEAARELARFVEACQNALALPGNNVTSADLEACAGAYSSASCAITKPAACQLPPGSQPVGAACNESAQCQSNMCSMSGSGSAAGSGCGTCGAAIAAGQRCGGTVKGECAQGSVCNLTGTPPTCEALIYGDAGATCDGLAAQCQPGLYCDAKMKCAAALPSGAACTGTYECTPPLTCTGTAPKLACRNPGNAGVACARDADCAPGLGCSDGKTCGTVTWASGGQACGNLARCLVGFCPFDPTGKQAGKCPTVIADGQPCDPKNLAEMCDVAASCVGGTCTLGDSVVCM